MFDSTTKIDEPDHITSDVEAGNKEQKEKEE